MRKTRIFGIAAALGVAIAIGLAGYSPRAEESPETPPSHLPSVSLPIPIIRQATEYSCGAAALLSVLTYWNAYDGDESSLYEALETTEQDGTHPEKLVEGARKFGLDATLRTGMSLEDLRQAVAAGDTVILDIQAWRDPETNLPWSENWEDGHYVVLVGLDERFAFFMDPSSARGYAYLPLPELLERWHDYEDRYGPVVRYQGLGIVIRGKNALERYPSSFVRLR